MSACTCPVRSNDCTRPRPSTRRRASAGTGCRSPRPSWSGRRAYLQFDAASRAAKVWVNGTYLGEHQGGFSRFRLDATDALRADGRNVLVVRTDNSKPAPGSATVDNLPLTPATSSCTAASTVRSAWC
ncbi:sugar-binding domain-containing protein [Caulobacter segnis]